MHIDLDDLNRPEIAELLKEHLTSMCACRVLFSIAGAFAACGFFGPQEQVRQEPAGRLIASLRAIRWSLRTSHPFKKKFRVNPVKSEPDWLRSELTTQAVVTAVEPSQLLILGVRRDQ